MFYFDPSSTTNVPLSSCNFLRQTTMEKQFTCHKQRKEHSACCTILPHDLVHFTFCNCSRSIQLCSLCIWLSRSPKPRNFNHLFAPVFHFEFFFIYVSFFTLQSPVWMHKIFSIYSSLICNLIPLILLKFYHSCESTRIHCIISNLRLWILAKVSGEMKDKPRMI